MKRLIVCFDGTWNTADNQGNPTNVVRLARMIPPTDPKGIHQLVFYDAGVGTGNWFDRVLGGAFGNGLEKHIKNAYLFLAQNHEPDDEIYLFGFSRGAFTARSLAGFIGACRGLLRRDALSKLELAWRFYRQKPEDRSDQQFDLEIRQSVAADTMITCLGIWDTVGSLGIPGGPMEGFNRLRYAFHDLTLSQRVRNAFQALAIDEHRRPFDATLWQRPKETNKGQVVEQVWFPGVHANIGGGYPDTEISDLPLRWMIARALSHTGLQVDPKRWDYFVPDFGGEAFPERINNKWQGVLYNSLGWQYLHSKLVPQMRLMGNQPARRGSGPFPKLFRTAKKVKSGSFCEAVHWSAEQRGAGAKAADIAPYDPHNWHRGETQLPIVQPGDEVKPGKPWA